MQTTEGSRSLTLETCFPAPFPRTKTPNWCLGAGLQTARRTSPRLGLEETMSEFLSSTCFLSSKLVEISRDFSNAARKCRNQQHSSSLIDMITTIMRMSKFLLSGQTETVSYSYLPQFESSWLSHVDPVGEIQAKRKPNQAD
ncbi:hypothetical protein CEXT_769201 [Caerostris extrusa]|uniref:Uncharacterized protein n=1 Tax=Caerostris extrusa TaxID=172846 RepID=A0AAV4XCY2_CAEEX|nr:hypothetical protein CEXT_769201 [Caerostris extrusa]